MSRPMPHDEAEVEGVAVIGLSGRFPGAGDVHELWSNLRRGVESISSFSAEELAAEGVDPAILEDPAYVNAAGALRDVAHFDAPFFGFTARAAEITDPQQRLFLECAWESLEDAGYDPQAFAGRIGVYAGSGANSYHQRHVQANRPLFEAVGAFRAFLGNEKDFLATLVSYKLNLRGPSLNLQTACSTSLVAVHYACQELLTCRCDMALAGGVSVRVPNRVGYFYREGSIASPDGHCRAFDARAAGTVSSSGVGVVVLKRLADALADGDHVYAVIRGSAVNNDGSFKVGFTAPSVEGQAEVIAEAQAVAGVEPRTITYVEAHGTGTSLGDPIELAALTQVFRSDTPERGFCAIGSLKTNLGHLDAAAGVAGLIKTALALEHREIPPSLHFENPNPKIDFENSPFYVNRTLSEWRAGGGPRRAGVSSFGIGGTNAHAVLEEAPPRPASGPSRSWQILTLSARTGPALEAATVRLAGRLESDSREPLADVAYTLQVGRRAFDHRRFVVCRDRAEAAAALRRGDPGQVFTGVPRPPDGRAAFLFPGQGAQHAGMGAGLYRAERSFREEVDRCAGLLRPHLGRDLREVLFPAESRAGAAAEEIRRTELAQPALFVVEYALAKLWMEWGVRPEAMLGHSVGEYVAATLAGVFSLEDALALVAARGRLMQSLPGGAMLAVPLAEEEVLPLLGGELSLAAVNAPEACTVSGPADAVERLRARLEEAGAACRLLRTSHAFHSAMMDPVADTFAGLVRAVPRRPPEIPFVSNLSGTWITPEQATDPRYWAGHLRETVRFSAGVRALWRDGDPLLLEVGPGRTLGALVRKHPGESGGRAVLASLPHPREPAPDQAFLLAALGRAWLAGVPVDWPGVYRHETRHRVPLPSYPFERRRHWAERQETIGTGGEGRPASAPAAEGEPAPADPPAAVDDAPEGELEGTVATLWRGLLGVARVGRHDNFFDLGADSLAVVQLLSRLHATYPVQLTARAVFEAPTTASLAAVIEEKLVERIEQLSEDDVQSLLDD